MKRAKINCMADVHAVDVEWLWKPYLPRGKVAAIRYGILSIASTEERMPRTPLRVVTERALRARWNQNISRNKK